MDDTIRQFDLGQIAPRATACPECRQFFAADARFCPFDGSSLQPATGYDPSRDPLIGQVIDGRYKVEAVLGEGGMGTVYRVVHTSLGRQLALKALRRDLAEDPDLAARFVREAKAAGAIAHPNIVQISDFGSLSSGQPYFVMEFLTGVSLRQMLLSGEKLAPKRVLSMVDSVAEALAMAHDAGIIQRDVKPDNILIQRNPSGRDVVKVLDFGLARVAGASRLTRKGIVFGTPHYMSPEQATGEVLDQRSDIYSLGVVLYELITGKVPFEADTYMGVLTKHIYVQPVPPTRFAGGEELAQFENVVMRCLRKDPKERYGSMAEVLEDLHAVGNRPRAGSLPAPSPSKPRSRGPLWLVLSAVALALAASALVLLPRPPSGDQAAEVPSATAPQSDGVEDVPSASQATPITSSSTVLVVEEPSPPTPTPSRAVRPVATVVPKSAPAPAGTPAPPAKPNPGSSEIVNPWAQ